MQIFMIAMVPDMLWVVVVLFKTSPIILTWLRPLIAIQFSYEGLRAIFDYLEELDENYDLDVIAICCDYVECDNWEEARDMYTSLGSDANEIEVFDFLHDNTVVVSESPLIFQQF